MTAIRSHPTTAGRALNRLHPGYGLALVGAMIGTLGALLEAGVGGFWATGAETGPYLTADYWFTASALPVAAGAILVVAGVRRQQAGADGRLGLAGLVLTGVCLTALTVVILASLYVGHDVQGGPTYVLGALGSTIGIALFAAGSWQTRLVPRWMLAIWPILWGIGSFFAVSVSPLLLAGFYLGLLLMLRRRAARSTAATGGTGTFG